MAFEMIFGTIQVTGPHDVGKSTFAWQYVEKLFEESLANGSKPPKVVFLDDDVKGRGTSRQLMELGIDVTYIDLAAMDKGRKISDFHKSVVETINQLPSDCNVLIWDTWKRFSTSIRTFTISHEHQFRSEMEWSAKGDIHGAERNREATEYEGQIISELTAKFDTVFLISHLQNEYIGKMASGRKVPASGDAVDRVCRLRLWLDFNDRPGNPVPIGLVLKRIDKKLLIDGKISTVCVLPQKLVPASGDGSLWDRIQWYMQNPIGNRELEEHEKPTPEEFSIISGVLTERQKQWFEKIIQAGSGASEDEDSSPAPVNAKLDLNAKKQKVWQDEAKELLKSMTIEEVATKLNKPMILIKKSQGGE